MEGVTGGPIGERMFVFLWRVGSLLALFASIDEQFYIFFEIGPVETLSYFFGGFSVVYRRSSQVAQFAVRSGLLSLSARSVGTVHYL